MKYTTLDVKAIVTKETLDRMAEKQKTDKPITPEDAPTNAEITEGRSRENLTRGQKWIIKLKAAGGMLVKGLIAAASETTEQATKPSVIIGKIGYGISKAKN